MRLVLLLILTTALASATDHFRVYTTDDGLPSNSVLGIRQARDGYIWFTTSRGLVRFDGVHFQVFDASNVPAIHGTNFAAFSLIEASDGTLWAGTWNAGAIACRNGHFRSITTRDGLPSNQVVRIDEDAKHVIWIFTTGGLTRIIGGKVEIVKFIEGESLEPYRVAPSNLGIDPYLFGLWRYHRSGLQRFAYGRWSDIPLPPNIDPKKAKLESLLEDTQQRLWFNIIGRRRQSFRVVDGRLTTFSGLPPSAFVNYEDRQGRLWITDPAGHNALWKDGHVFPLPNVSTGSPFRVLEDNTGGFWLGTRSAGLAHGINQLITTIRTPGGSEANVIGPILQDSAGDIWAGSYGLTRIHKGYFSRYVEAHSGTNWRAAQIVFGLWADRDGSLLVGYSDGVKAFRNGHYEPPPMPLRRIKSSANAILRDQAGILWLGTEDGLYSFDNITLRFFNSGNSALHGEVRALFEDHAHTLWIGTDDLLCRYRDSKFACAGPSDPLSQWRVLSIAEDSAHVIWVSTADKGLLRIDGDRFRWIQKKDGLFANDGGSILEDSNGYFWIGCQLGIYRVRRHDLDEFAAGRINHVESTFFGKADGLDASNCKGNGQPHGFVANDGALWFPTSGGLARIDARSMQLDRSPPAIHIESCTVDQHLVACANHLSLPPEARSLEIRYNAFSLIRPDQMKFRYRLKGFDDTWVNAENRDVAYFSRLPPGQYRFAVTAANSDGFWNLNAKELTIDVRPHYYQSAAFRSALAAATIVSIFLAWRLRTVQFRRRQAAQRAFTQEVISSQEAERKRIAGELHDSLGQRLALIGNMVRLLSRSASEDAKERMEAIAEEASQAASEVRQISQNLRPYQLDLLGLTKAMEMLTQRTCERASIKSDIVADDLSEAIPRDLEIHLYRVLQECLNNVVKHSRATEVQVLVQRTKDHASLVVTDNGIGFGRQNGDGQAAGFGLRGILERSQLLGGFALVQTTPGHGTTVRLEVPLGGSHA